jgi:lipopolysaccharide transport system ATP-binding protein
MTQIIDIKNVSKKYRLGESRGLSENFREAVVDSFGKLWRTFQGRPSSSAQGVRDEKEAFWALRDVSLSVDKGDTVAIIGSNGAGKSTLLKVLSRITDPTEGHIRVKGRMASLLEVGTGFHPELTGRENIYLNGSILGMRREEITATFDEIVSFAGIGKFLDTPVKRYSSGMYVRLAFSIAAHLDPEILVVDEVLAVGDVAFQKKCLGKMAEACSRQRTVLFVSHNLAAVEALCNRGIVLQEGRVVFNGNSKDAIQFYLRNLSDSAVGSGTHIVDLSAVPQKTGKHRRQLKSLELYAQDDQPITGEVPIGTSLKAVVHFTLEDPCTSFDAWVAFDSASGQRICTAHSAYEPDRTHEERSGEQTFVCTIPNLPLLPGQYRVGVGLDIGGHEVESVDNATVLNVIKSDFYGTGVVPTRGAFLLENRWTLVKSKEKIPEKVTA